MTSNIITIRETRIFRWQQQSVATLWAVTTSHRCLGSARTRRAVEITAVSQSGKSCPWGFPRWAPTQTACIILTQGPSDTQCVDCLQHRQPVLTPPGVPQFNTVPRLATWSEHRPRRWGAQSPKAPARQVAACASDPLARNRGFHDPLFRFSSLLEQLTGLRQVLPCRYQFILKGADRSGLRGERQ